MALTKPPVLPPWADAGDKIQPSNAEIQAGWPLSSIPPSRQRFNWLLNFLSNGVRYLSRRGISDWDSTETYDVNDRVLGPDGKTYMCLTAANINKNPTASPADWRLWGLDKADLDAAYLRRDAGNVMSAYLPLKQGAAAPNNANNAGAGFYGDPDTGLFSPADGVLQLASNGEVFFENNAQGSASFKKGVRAPKGAPTGSDVSNLSGYTFDQDGDTGLFAEGGTSISGSDLVLRVDNNVVGRLKAGTVAPDTNDEQLAKTSFVIGQASSIAPNMDGAAAVGTSQRYARADHVHPSDTSRVSKAGDTMAGVLHGRSGAATPSNTNNAGFCFSGDPDSGMFNSADGFLQLATNGQVFLENNAGGALKVLKQFRVPKGAPNSADVSTNAGYTFNDDGDTGLFAEGGSANSGSDLVLRIDNGEVARFKAAMKNAAGSGWVRLSSGIIIQWGSFVQTDTGSVVSFTWTFPIVFPNAALQAFLTVGNLISGSAINCSAEGFGTTAASGFTLGPAGSRTYRIFVIGH